MFQRFLALPLLIVGVAIVANSFSFELMADENGAFLAQAKSPSDIIRAQDDHADHANLEHAVQEHGGHSHEHVDLFHGQIDHLHDAGPLSDSVATPLPSSQGKFVTPHVGIRHDVARRYVRGCMIGRSGPVVSANQPACESCHAIACPISFCFDCQAVVDDGLDDGAAFAAEGLYDFSHEIPEYETRPSKVGTDESETMEI